MKNLLKLILIFIIFNTKTDQKAYLYWWKPQSHKSNFGDELSPLIVEKIIGKKVKHCKQKQKFLALGSILHMASDGSLIWGTGLNGKIPLKQHNFKTLDVRAVRGPLTRKFLLSKGIECPEIFGDPALLLPILFKDLKVNPKRDYIIIPHINEMYTVKGYTNVVLPTEDCMTVVNKILESRFVISSSLHGIIVAEAFGIPARLLRITEKENIFKYKDYYYGTGRTNFKVAKSVEEALAMGGEVKPTINLKQLLDSFPFDKFS